MLKNKVKTAIATAAAFVVSATPAFADSPSGLPQLKFGSVCDLITGITGIIAGFAGAIALILLVMGGIQYMTSGGDKMAVEQARGRITSAVVGLAIVLGAYLVITTLGGALVEGFGLCPATL